MYLGPLLATVTSNLQSDWPGANVHFAPSSSIAVAFSPSSVSLTTKDRFANTHHFRVYALLKLNLTPPDGISFNSIQPSIKDNSFVELVFFLFSTCVFNEVTAVGSFFSTY